MKNTSEYRHGNDTSNSNVQFTLSYEAKITLYTLYGAICILGTTGNGVVIYLAILKKSKRPGGSVYILVLAVTDFFASIIIPLVMLNDLVTDVKWYFGWFLCKVLPGFNFMFLFASAWLLVAVSLERLRAVLYPFRQKLSATYTTITIVLIYIMSAGVMTPFSYYMKLKSNVCWIQWPSPEAHLVFNSVLESWTVFIPCFILAAVYTKVIHTLKKQKKFHRQAASAARQKRDIRLTKTCLLVVCTFFFLTMPYAIMLVYFSCLWVADNRYILQNWNKVQSLNYVLYTLQAFNSCMNPMIYAGTSRRKRSARSMRTGRGVQRMPVKETRAKKSVTVHQLMG